MSDLEQRLAEAMRADAAIWKRRTAAMERHDGPAGHAARYGVRPRPRVGITGTMNACERPDQWATRIRQRRAATYSGEACRRCGSVERYVSDRTCVECSRTKHARHRAKRIKQTNNSETIKH